VAALWNYTGLNAKEMENRITTIRMYSDHHGQLHRVYRIAILERLVSDQSLFPAGAKVKTALTQIGANASPVMRQTPPGTTLPFITPGEWTFAARHRECGQCAGQILAADQHHPVHGMRASLQRVLKVGAVSTLDNVNKVQDKLPVVAGAPPPSLKIEPLADQSVFMRAAISGVIREA
jgi:hypothetical protein